jgi:hypothetical protein
MRRKAELSMMRRAPFTSAGLLTHKALMNRHGGVVTATEAFAQTAIKHPGRNLKPVSRIGATQRAAEDKIIRLVDLLMDEDWQTKPWMPPIQKLAKADPVGVIYQAALYNGRRPFEPLTARHPIKPTSPRCPSA